MLRITTNEGPETATMQLEGRVTGPWASEVQKAWHSLAFSLGSRKLRVDLRGVTHVDANGKQILSEIYSKTRAEFLANTPMTKYFADQATSNGGQNGEER
jgi:anti-anti-sigma regulatory factor